MSDKTCADQVPAMPAEDFVQRSLTPVYNYRIEGAPYFKHSGSHGALRFDLLLRPCPTPTNWLEVAEFAKPSVREEIERRVGYDSDHFGTTASHFLTTDVAGPADSVGGVAWNTSYSIHALVVYGLCLHSTGGMQHHGRYSYWLPPAPYGGLNYNSYYSRQLPFPHLGRVSVLQAAAFDACRNTIDVLMGKMWGNATFDKVLLLAMEYHRLSFTLERVEHGFLILMVAYEAMFKKENENASKPAQRIGRLLGAATKKDCKAIQREFNDDPDSFSKIRNQIAHGDPNLNLATVATKYPSLYRHVTAAIVTLLNLPSGSLDDTKDYYDEISRLAESRFLGLPNS